LFFFVASTIGLLLTGSRAAFLGFIFGLVIIYIFSNYKFRIYSLFAAGLLVLVVLFYSQQFVLFNRTASIAETADLRFSYWNDALKIFYEFPWGIGIGNYKSYVSLYSQNQYWDFFGDFVYMDHPENGYLKILVELGIGGFVLFFSFLLRPLALSFYSFLYPERRSSRQVVMVAAILSWMVAFITVYSLNDIRIFVLVASLVSLIVCEQKKN
jgi:O-antigen ligase